MRGGKKAAQEAGKIILAFAGVALVCAGAVCYFSRVNQTLKDYCSSIDKTKTPAMIVPDARMRGYQVHEDKHRMIIEHPLLFGRATCTVSINEDSTSSHYQFLD